MEQRTIDNQIDSLDRDTILWLLRTSSNAAVRALVIEAMGNVQPEIVPALTSALVYEHAVWEQYHELLKDSLIPSGIDCFRVPRAGYQNRVDRLLEVQHRLTTPTINASEAPLTACMVPNRFFENRGSVLSMLVISLLDMQGAGGERKLRLRWPSPVRLISRVIRDGCKLPWHTWQDFFVHVDLASMCVLHTADIPDAQSFCGTYLRSHAEWYDSNNGLAQSTKPTERTGVFTLTELLPHFERANQQRDPRAVSTI